MDERFEFLARGGMATGIVNGLDLGFGNTVSMNKSEEEKEIYVTRPSMPPYEEYVKAIRPLWESKILTNMGPFHQQLEKELAKYLDVPEISLTVNGHMALELAIQAFGFPKGGEVITTPFTFVSTTHAIVRNGLIPVFCDVKEADGTMDEALIESLITDKTVAILPVHVYGNVCNVEAIQEIAERHSLKAIYDAAHAFGVKYKGIGIGNYGDASIFSFHATKVFNTVEGGTVACKDRGLYEKLYNLKNFGIRGEELVESVGCNAKMNELSAVMGLCNLKHMDEATDSRKTVFEAYMAALNGMKWIRVLQGNPEATQNYGYFPVAVSEESGTSRDAVFQALADDGIHARKYFYPLACDQKCYKEAYGVAEVPVARKLAKRVLTLPIFEGITVRETGRIAGIIKSL